jgi:hypothetical protein
MLAGVASTVMVGGAGSASARVEVGISGGDRGSSGVAWTMSDGAGEVISGMGGTWSNGDGSGTPHN